jgi:hypothetical protein
MNAEVKECPKCKQKEMHNIVTNLDNKGAELPHGICRGFFCFACRCWIDVIKDRKPV